MEFNKALARSRRNLKRCSDAVSNPTFIALRAAAAAVKQEDDCRLFHNAALRKCRKEASSDHRLGNGDVPPENGSHKGVQYPFSVNEKVLIKGNRRTPDKFVGKEAVITAVCLNGWYLRKGC